METNASADESASETPPENAAPEREAEVAADRAPDPDADPEVDSGPGANPPEQELAQLAGEALTRRLSPAEEERAIATIKDCLLGGKTGVAAVAEALPKFAWMVGVAGVTAAWSELKATTKTQLLKALAENETDGARRVRLSLARALFKLPDLATSLKLAVAVAKEMRAPETGEISPRDAQIFASVFLGKAKPWCAQIPLAELKPAEADALVHCALVSAFSLPHPPVTQLGVLKWTAESGRLAKLDEQAVDAITPSLSRWSAKWQSALRTEIPGLPDPFLAVLKPAAEPSDPGSNAATEDRGFRPATGADSEGPREGDAPDTFSARTESEGGAPQKERPVYVSKTIPPRESRGPAPAGSAPASGGSRGGPGKSAQFNLSETLRQIETHVASLRTELKHAESKLRSRPDEAPRSRRRAESVVIEGEPTIEELARLNVQLEARIAMLQSRIDELTADSEDRAASRGASGGSAPPNADQELRTLLALKLQDDYADFLALEQESRDLVVQQHYRSLLREVFEVLKREGVPLDADDRT